jgi:uncharacterized protein with ParB-like and HNH nuclease domain
MKANETKVEDFLASNKTQFIIPIYQRNYDWSPSQCSQLLSDILEVGDSSNLNAHFIGSIVYVHDDVYTSSRIKELIIIDGQQRLTTLTLIYLVLFHIAKSDDDEGLFNEINETYLINKFAADDEKLKLRPTENNDKALRYLIRADENEEYNHFSKIIDNFNYFRTNITSDNINQVMNGLSKLMFVEISLDRAKDNPQRIFESLNSTGLELSQADLIRNYILMGLSKHEQTRVYKNYWETIEKLAKDENTNKSKVSDFIRDFLTLESNKVPNKGKVYVEFKKNHDHLPSTTVENTLTRLKSLVKHYNKLINPENEENALIKKQLQYISKLEINVAHPFLMKVYEDYYDNNIEQSEFLSILELVQSFTWRRVVIGLPTNALNKIFMTLYDKIDPSKYVESIQRSLASRSGIQRFPNDAETLNALKEKDFYNIKSKSRTYLLERLENHNNKESVVIDGNSQITIEHIFPQNPDAQWREELNEDEFLFIKDNYLNTIGNLTLSGNNGQLSNKYFTVKRDMPDAGYRDSRLWLNKHLSTLSGWKKSDIEKRTSIISERFLQVWSCPPPILGEYDSNEVNIMDADDPTFKKLEYAILLDQKINVREVTKLYSKVFEALFTLEPEQFFSSSLNERLSLTKTPNTLRKALPISDTYFIESNISSIDKFERIKEALVLFKLEDELSIKYESNYSQMGLTHM